MTGVAATCELWIDGVRFADGAGDTTAPTALTDLVIRWGRDNRIDQPQAAQLTASVLDRGGGPTRWDQLIGLGSTVTVWAVVDGGARVGVFTGRVTDLDGQWDDQGGGTLVKLASADQLAELANRFVGAEPWAAELFWQRAVRITGGDSSVWAPIPWPPGGLTVSRMDVDRQAAAALLAQLGVTGGTIIFPALFSDGRELMVAQNPAARASMFILAPGDDGLWRPTPAQGLGAYELPADLVRRDPVVWRRSVVDLVTRATVRWLDQTTSPGTTERSVSIVNTADEDRWGARGLSLSTILTTSDDATKLVAVVLVRNQATDAYRAAGLVWDLDVDAPDPAAAAELAAVLLDSSARTGTGVFLTGLPDWTPASADGGGYVEGGTYSFTDGRWVLSLDTTAAAGSGPSITYEQTPRPAPSYAQFAPDVSYLDLYGVGAPPAVAAVPAPSTFGPADPPTAAPTGTTPKGLPYPEPTDPYYATPAALAALRDATLPKLGNLAFQFFPAARYIGNATGDCVLDLTAKFTAIKAAVISDANGASGNPCHYQILNNAPAGVIWFRVLTTAPPDGAIWANPDTWVSVMVWGTPK